MGRLDGKVAIVTGAASGIGAATVRRFVEEGARVVIADINDDGGTAIARSLGDRAAFRHTDVTSLADLEATVAFTVDRFGGLDVMHNNAAATGGGYVGEIDPEVWDFSLKIMLTGVFYVDTKKPSFTDMLNLVDEPLATLPESRTRPPREVLDQIMQRHQ